MCRINALRLEEKEKAEKELRSQIIQEGEEYIKAFHEKRLKSIETNKLTNREGEKVSCATIPSSLINTTVYHTVLLNLTLELCQCQNGWVGQVG